MQTLTYTIPVVNHWFVDQRVSKVIAVDSLQTAYHLTLPQKTMNSIIRIVEASIDNFIYMVPKLPVDEFATLLLKALMRENKHFVVHMDDEIYLNALNKLIASRTAGQCTFTLM